MDKTIRRIVNRKEQRAETYRYWQSLPAGERFAAVWEAAPKRTHSREFVWTMNKDLKELLLAFDAQCVK